MARSPISTKGIRKLIGELIEAARKSPGRFWGRLRIEGAFEFDRDGALSFLGSARGPAVVEGIPVEASVEGGAEKRTSNDGRGWLVLEVRIGEAATNGGPEPPEQE